MENQKSDGDILKEYLYGLPYSDVKAEKKRIIEACMIPTYTLANWMSGYSRVPMLAKAKINEITGKNVFELINK